ncbi:2-hydroxyacid dehydrogenase [Aidingimonas halophila]|uniref:Glyoxylate/hydroxypyruvate reductase A n=1 Tax=Aidingimonas halophila TaxID=574349 RepID=A0A1H2SCN6_9GAMM|nr:glyoxylate/hydroxypyruvate reductase A [Aidingimonas halophila]GHC17831.1 glyoxylate/hydroxypyruvate reductase A [Aidingimonas halophila]SDW29416.1 glyoxylate/hydroxypyruvate reductase A [Aidingimonas halophila]
MKILIHIDDIDQWRDALARRLPEAEIVTSESQAAERQGADYLAVWKPSAELLQEQTCLKGIVNLGAGVDALLNNPGLPRNVPIVKLRDAGMGELIADYTRYGVFHFQRDFDRYLRQETTCTWREVPVVDKSEWPIGVLGLGAIGQHVALSLAADGFPVHGWSRSAKDIDGLTCHHGSEGLWALLRQVRTLVLLLPDTPSTRGIINTETLAALPEGATLINPGRGALIDESALLEALGPEAQEGQLRGALLDAFPEEPLPAESELWTHPRIRITPHMAGPTPMEAALDQAVDAIRAWEAGEPVTTVDPEAGY